MQLRTSNVFWSALEAAIAAIMSFVSAFLVARIVGPAEVGVGAAVVAVHVLIWVVVNALFADPLVQRAELSDDDACSAFWASVLAGVAGGLVQAALGWPLAASIGDPRILAMSLALAAPLPLVGAGGAIQGLLTRNRSYKVLAGRALIGQGLGTLAGVVMAFAGAGAWALVGQQVVTSLAGALSLMLRAHWRPRLVMRAAPVWELLRLGAPLVASTLVLLGRYRVFAVLIGGTAGPAALGQVHMAFRLVDTVRELISTAMWRLGLPTLSERQDDLPALQRAMARFLDLSGLVLFPVMGAMLVVIHPLVRLLLGPVWASTAGAAAPLILLAVYTFLYFPAGIGLVARGITAPTLAANIAAVLLTIAGVLVLRPATPESAAMVWLATQAVLVPPLLVVTGRRLGTTPLELCRAGLPSLLLACLATAAAFLVPRLLGEPADPLLLILCRLAVGTLVYLPAALFLLRASVSAALRSAGLHRRAA
jgi:PST family polysaccharide transporter